MKKRIVIKLSGSIFDPERPALIEKFAVFLVKISKVCQPIVIAGGGKIARHYMSMQGIPLAQSLSRRLPRQFL